MSGSNSTLTARFSGKSSLAIADEIATHAVYSSNTAIDAKTSASTLCPNHLVARAGSLEEPIMTRLSQSIRRLSIVSLYVAMLAPTMASAKDASLYYGRWTVSEDRPVFTVRGAAYKTIDIAACGRDFCGISVDDKGRCGPLLFRFLGKHAATETLRGHGRWGSEQKNVVIMSYGASDNGENLGFELYLGDGYSLGSRSGSMPKFHAEYKRLGASRCVAR